MKTSSFRTFAVVALAVAAVGVGLFWNQRRAARRPAPVAAKVLPDKSAVRLAMERRLAGENFELRRIALPERLNDRVSIALGEQAGAPQLKLKRHSVRGENFRVIVQGEDGALVEVPAGPVRTYVGEVAGDSSSTVSATLWETGLSAQIESSERPRRAIAPLTKEEAMALGGDVPGHGPLHAIFTPQEFFKEGDEAVHDSSEGEPRAGSVKKSARDEATTEALGQRGEMEIAAGQNLHEPPVEALGSPVTVKQAEMGFDVTYRFLNERCGNDLATAVTTVEDWMNSTHNPVFISGPLIEHVIGVIMIRTNAAADPYTGLTTGSAALTKVKDVWNGNVAAFPRPSTTHDLATCVLNAALDVTGLAYVGVVGGSSRYSICTARSGMGYWRSGLRHEVGHNWSLSHGDGCGEPYISDPQMGLMCGGYHERANSVEASKMLSHRNSRGAGVLVNLPVPYTARPFGPYCPQDIGYTAGVSGGTITLDVLANDYDCNNDDFTIEATRIRSPSLIVNQTPAPVAMTTPLGGSVIRSIGTGPGGRDRLLYTPPASGLGGRDEFHYTVRDTTGRSGHGFVRVTVGPPPPDPYGEIVRTGVRTDTILDWTTTPDSDTTSHWFPGYITGGAFTQIFDVAVSSAWLGGDGVVVQNGTTDPRLGQYSMESDTVRPAVRRWTSDYSGNLAVDYSVHRLQAGGNGVTVSIAHNGVPLWSQFVTNTELHFSGTVFAAVRAGDTIDLVENSSGDETDDYVQFQARIYERPHVREEAVLPSFHYRLDEGVEMASGAGGDYDRRHWAGDASTKNRPAVLFTSDHAQAWQRGMLGNAFMADGVDGYAETVDANIGDGTTELTLSVWFNPATKSDNAAMVSSTGVDFCGMIVSSYGAGNPVEFRLKSNRVTAPDHSGPSNRWTHAVGTWRAGAFQKLYLDGVEVTNSATPPTGTLDVDKWRFGKDRDFTDRMFHGRMDDVAIWKRAFDATEVQALHEQGRAYREFSGTNAAEAVVSADSYLAPAITEATVSAWVNVAAPGDKDGIFTAGSVSVSGEFLGLRLNHAAAVTNSVLFSVRGTATYLAAPADTVPPGEWTHVVGVWKSGVVQKLYVNGTPVASHAAPFAGTSDPGVWNTGRHLTDNTRLFAGKISDTVVIGRALTEDEVLDLYNVGRTAWDASHGLLTGATPIGALTLPGALAEGGGCYLLNASGTGLGGTGDSLQFSRLNHTGAGEITLRVDSVENTGTNAFAGLMLRASTNANAAFAMIAVRPDRKVSFTQRTNTGAAVNFIVPWQAGPSNAAWLRLLRGPDAIAARISTDGENWTPLGVLRGTFASGALVGIATSSGTPAALSTAVVGGVNANPFTDPDVDGDGLPDAWEILYFGSSAVSNGGGTDRDGDGATDWHEYLAGTNPNNAASVLRLAAAPTLPAPGQIQLQWQAATGLTYRITRATNLLGAWTPVATNIAAAVPVTTRTVPTAAPQSFFRVEVEDANP